MREQHSLRKFYMRDRSANYFQTRMYVNAVAHAAGEKKSHMRYYCIALQQYKGHTLIPAYHTVVNGGGWVDDVQKRGIL